MQFAYAAFHSSCIRNLTEIANISPVWIVSTVSRDLAFLRLDVRKILKTRKRATLYTDDISLSLTSRLTAVGNILVIHCCPL